MQMPAKFWETFKQSFKETLKIWAGVMMIVLGVTALLLLAELVYHVALLLLAELVYHVG